MRRPSRCGASYRNNLQEAKSNGTATAPISWTSYFSRPTDGMDLLVFQNNRLRISSNYASYQRLGTRIQLLAICSSKQSMRNQPRDSKSSLRAVCIRVCMKEAASQHEGLGTEACARKGSFLNDLPLNPCGRMEKRSPPLAACWCGLQQIA